jgi:phage major head subunit gpT-like protein
MSNILNDLGIDTDDFDWWHLGICRGMDTNLFYDKYEADPNVAKSIDEACLSCPVIKMCYKSGIENSEYGVWGGVYMSSGEIDKSKNLHKTIDIWKKLRSKGVH